MKMKKWIFSTCPSNGNTDSQYLKIHFFQRQNTEESQVNLTARLHAQNKENEQ